MRAPVRRKQPVHQRLQPVRLVDDDLRVLDQLLGFQLHLQQLRRATDAPQWVLDLVRKVADQLLVGLRLVDQALFALLPGLLFQRQQLDDDLPGGFGLRHHHVHGQWFVRRPPEPSVVTQCGELVATGAAQRALQQGGLGEAVLQQSACDAAPGHAQRVLQRRIGVEDGTVRSDHGHQGGQQVQRLESQRGGRGSRHRPGWRRRCVRGKGWGGEGRLFQATYFAAVPGVPEEPSSRPNSRRIPATSASARATAALSSATRSR
ncbi:hypothetical protein FQZ97_748870 [compost metagenome]